MPICSYEQPGRRRRSGGRTTRSARTSGFDRRTRSARSGLHGIPMGQSRLWRIRHHTITCTAARPRPKEARPRRRGSWLSRRLWGSWQAWGSIRKRWLATAPAYLRGSPSTSSHASWRSPVESGTVARAMQQARGGAASASAGARRATIREGKQQEADEQQKHTRHAVLAVCHKPSSHDGCTGPSTWKEGMLMHAEGGAREGCVHVFRTSR